MVLTIDTADQKTVTVGLKKAQQIVQQLSEQNQFGSQVLLPLIQKLLRSNQLKFENLSGIEVNIGPGSYTGLRVGVSVAQVLGYTLNIPVNGQIGKQIEIRYT